MKKLIAKILSVIMLATMFLQPEMISQAAEKTGEKSRAIYVVFDNSGSMYGPGNKAWSQAVYAMEVFAAMMNYENEDIMKVFPMHDVTTKGESGEVSYMTISSQKHISKIHNMYTPEPLGTPYTQVNTAAKELTKLLEDGKKDEGWLIVLTDGEFDADVPNNLRNDLKEKASKNESLYVQYLAIGEDVKTVPDGDESIGFYSQKAGNSSEVVNELAVICNRIFKRNEYNYDGQSELKFDIPISKVIVFAQGKNVNINGLKNKEGGTVKLAESVKVSYNTTDGSGRTSYVTETPTKDKSLTGEVAIFADDSSIVANNYVLDVQGADSVKVYYEPDVEFGIGLFDGEKQMETSSIEGGKYYLYVGFIERLTGKFITNSKLLGEPQYTLTVNGKPVDIPGGTTAQVMEIDVDGEQLAVEAGVTYLNDYIDSASCEFKVCTLDMEVDMPKSINVKSLEDADNAMTISVSRNGKPLTEEEWNNANLEISCVNSEGEPFAVDWVLEKGDKVSTWKVSLKHEENDYFKTETGKAVFSVDMETDIEGMKYGTAKEVNTKIVDDKTIVDFMKHYWKQIVISLLGLILLLGYIPPFKKYFSRKMKKRPTINCNAEKTGIHDMVVKGTFEKNLVSTLIPYKPETGRLTFSPAPVKNTAKIRAAGGNGMFILNTKNFAGKDHITFNGMAIPDNYKGNYRISASTIINVLTPEFTYECIPNVQRSSDGSIKKSKSKKKR